MERKSSELERDKWGRTLGEALDERFHFDATRRGRIEYHPGLPCVYPKADPDEPAPPPGEA